MLQPRSPSRTSQPVAGAIRAVRAALRSKPAVPSAAAARRLRSEPQGRDPRVLAYALGYDVLCTSEAVDGDARPSGDPSFVGVVCYAWDRDPAVRSGAVLRGLAKALLAGVRGGQKHVGALAAALATMV